MSKSAFKLRDLCTIAGVNPVTMNTWRNRYALHVGSSTEIRRNEFGWPDVLAGYAMAGFVKRGFASDAAAAVVNALRNDFKLICSKEFEFPRSRRWAAISCWNHSENLKNSDYEIDITYHASEDLVNLPVDAHGIYIIVDLWQMIDDVDKIVKERGIVPVLTTASLDALMYEAIAEALKPKDEAEE
jgi:hypothetical protein